MSNRSDALSPAAPGPFVTAAILLLSAMTVMANATISASLPGLREHFSDVAGIETLAGFILTLPSLAVVLTAGMFGWLADLVDRQKLLLAAGLLYAIGGTSGLWVEGLPGLLIGRIVLGVGVAGTMVLATTWAADLWPEAARAQFLGRQGAAMSAGGIGVILIGGAFASLHWRGAFATYLLVLPVTGLAFHALAPYVPQRHPVRQSLVQADADREPFPWVVFAFVGSLGFLFMAAFYVMPTRLPFLLAEVGVTSPLMLSAVISLVTLAALPGALAFGRIRLRLSALAVFALSWTLMGLGTLILAAAPNMIVMALGVIVVGLGLGPSMPNYTAYLMASVPSTSRGRASGLLTTAFFAGQFASPLVLAPMVGGLGLRGAFQAMGVLQLTLACGLVVAMLRQERKRTQA
jgi:MFS family permease